MHIKIIILLKKGLLDECDKEENVEVTWAVTTSCLKRRFKNVLSNVAYSPSHRLAGPLHDKFTVNTLSLYRSVKKYFTGSIVW